MFDPKSKRRMYLAQLDVEKYCARYKNECKDLGNHKITPEEQEEFEHKIRQSQPSSYLATRLQSTTVNLGKGLFNYEGNLNSLDE